MEIVFIILILIVCLSPFIGLQNSFFVFVGIPCYIIGFLIVCLIFELVFNISFSNAAVIAGILVGALLVMTHGNFEYRSAGKAKVGPSLSESSDVNGPSRGYQSEPPAPTHLDMSDEQISNDLIKLKLLRERGAIDDDEYARMKQPLLEKLTDHRP